VLGYFMFMLHLPLHQTAPLLLLLLLLAVAAVICCTSCSIVAEHMSFKLQCCSHHVWVSLCQATYSICIMLWTLHLLVRRHSIFWYELEHCNASNKCCATNAAQQMQSPVTSTFDLLASCPQCHAHSAALLQAPRFLWRMYHQFRRRL